MMLMILCHTGYTRSNFCFHEIKYCKFQVIKHIFITSPVIWSQDREHNPTIRLGKNRINWANIVFFCSSGPNQISKKSTALFPSYTWSNHFTYCVTAGARTGCDPWPWCCSSNGGCGTGAGTLRSSPWSRTRWPASPWDAGGTAGAACSPARGCCHTSPGSPGYPCTCRGDRGNSHGNQEYMWGKSFRLEKRFEITEVHTFIYLHKVMQAWWNEVHDSQVKGKLSAQTAPQQFGIWKKNLCKYP